MDIPIVMVMGNHEYYRRFVPDELALARSQAPNFNIRLIENDSVTLGVGGNTASASSAPRSGPITVFLAR
jgi:hypothetical protein